MRGCDDGRDGEGLRLVERDLDLAVEDAAGPRPVDVLLPGADHDRRDALPIRLVSARPMPMNQSTDEHQHEADRRNRRERR